MGNIVSKGTRSGSGVNKGPVRRVCRVKHRACQGKGFLPGRGRVEEGTELLREQKLGGVPLLDIQLLSPGLVILCFGLSQVLLVLNFFNKKFTAVIHSAGTTPAKFLWNQTLSQLNKPPGVFSSFVNCMTFLSYL